jgi:hypothetical protein
MLIIRKGWLRAAKARFWIFCGKLTSAVYHNFVLYESSQNDPGYRFTGERLDSEGIQNLNEYVSSHILGYKREQKSASNIERLLEYYPYKIIEREMGGKPLRICNVGCFYCGADYMFLEKHPECSVYGLDFGNILEVNRNLNHPHLKLFPGYPLETLEGFVNDSRDDEYMFDFTIFNRTATLINIEQLLAYMKCIEKLSRKIILVEVGKLTTYSRESLDVRQIDLMNPVRIYAGMFIHNYPQLLEKSNYRIVEEAVLHHDAFDQDFSADDEFIYICGEKVTHEDIAE